MVFGVTNLLHERARGRYVYSKLIAEWKNNSILGRRGGTHRAGELASYVGRRRGN